MVMDKLITKEINTQALMVILEKNYQEISPLWSHHQMEWINDMYKTYKDHEKYMIVLYLVKKTFDFYSRHFVKESYIQFFEKDFIELDSFNVVEVARAINMPKESTRRKINELEKSGVIKRINKKIIIDKSIFPYVKPVKSVIRLSRFLSTMSNILSKEKILLETFESSVIEKYIKKNFSYIWKLYFEVQIPMLLNWKKIFKDMETFHIWAVCVVNQKLNIKKIDENKGNKKNYLKNFFYDDKFSKNGINAMSVSDITGIPRATVIRKLKILIKKRYLKINDKKLYSIAKVSKNHQQELLSAQQNTFGNLSKFISKIFSFLIIEKEFDHIKKHEKLTFQN